MKTLAISIIGLLLLASDASRTVQAGEGSRVPPPVRQVASLQLEEQIPVPGVAGRLDHFSADLKRRRLFISALGNNTVEVIDTFAGRIIQSIHGLNLPQGVLYVPDFDKLFVANAGDGTVRIFDGSSYALRKSLAIGEDPDNLRYDPVSRKVLVGYGEDDGGIAMIDPATEERVGPAIKTEGHPESFQLDSSTGRLYVNVPDAGNIVESVELKTGAIQKWPLKNVRQNYAMAFDEKGRRVFAMARKPPQLLVLDAQTGREVSRLPAAGECDDMFFDASRKRIYVIGAEGFVSVIQQKDPDHYELLENVPSAIGVKTGYFYERRDRLYVGLPAKGNDPAQVWTYEAQD